MAPSVRSVTESPSNRAALARKRLSLLPDNEIVYVDRFGPRILRIPPNPTVFLSRETLRELDKGNLTGPLGQGARFLTNRMLQCPEITIDTNGHYTVQKKEDNPKGRVSRSYTVKTLDVWTGKTGELHEDRDIADLIFYSVGPDLLPSYHSWKDDRLERRESSLEIERQQEAALSEQEFAACPMPIADVIDEYKEKYEAKMDEDASNDPENMLRFKPNILPSDPAWEGIEEYFKWILQYEREEDPDAPKVYRVLEDELLESQLLLLIPAINSGYRAKIQDENTEKYHEALRTTFQGKPDNLLTKLTMLCFGLPIAPLTLANVKFAGGLEDVPTDSEGAEKGLDGQIIERIVWPEKPLEFLDYYNERSYGYPMIRSQKRKYEQMDAETVEKLLAQAQERAKHPRLVWDGCGFPEMGESEQGLHLRGGAGNPAEVQYRKLWLYTEMGRFHLDDVFGSVFRVPYRVFRLVEDESIWKRCQWDLIPVERTDSGVEVDETRRPGHFIWIKSDTTENQPRDYEWFITPQREANDHWVFRMRLLNENTIPNLQVLDWRDAWEPTDNKTLVNLNVRGVGIAYWYLPANKPHGVNVLQDTFRNAIECLIPQHKRYHVQWDIQGNPMWSGQLLLITEAPSVALWDATQRALGSRPRVTIYITVLEDKRSNPLSVQILMPGFNSVGWYDRLPDTELSHQNPAIFQAIRNFALGRTEPIRTALRIWSGLENYDSAENLDGPRSMVLPIEQDSTVELDIWQEEGLAYTWDAVVVRPEFEDYKFISMTDQTKADMAYESCPSETLGAHHGHITLKRFRDVVTKLLVGFNPKEDYITIEQSQSDHTFIIGPEMTEVQWRSQVFDWFDNPTILFRRHERWPPVYAKDVINGPLGPTFNHTTARRTPDPTLGGEEVEGPPNEGIPPSTGPVTTGPVIKGPVTTGPVTTGLVTTAPVATGPETAGQGTIPPGDPTVGNNSLSGSLPDVTKERWATWRKEQVTEEQRRIEAYTKNGSIFQDGKNPQIPKFGPPIEGTVPGGGGRFPTIYTGMSTATENVERDREARELLNVVLERQDFCGVCQKALPGGAHNLEVRERHYREHRDMIREARLKAAQGSVQDVFYCEYCGKTPAEFEKENNGKKHGSACAYRGTFNSVPHFCQYCRLNFWDNDMTDKAVKIHVQKCANDRRVSPQGQINLYQQLLTRVVGRREPNGESICHFKGCEQIFNSATTKLARAIHFLRHLDGDDEEKLHCIFPSCNIEFNDFIQEQVIAHLNEHFGLINDRPNQTSNLCPIESCDGDFGGWTQEQIIAHLQGHVCPDDDESDPIYPACPFEGCDLELDGLTEKQITTHIKEHLRQHKDDPRCPFEGCGLGFNGATQKKIMAHFNEHWWSTKPCQLCNVRIRNDKRTIARHYVIHIGNHFCRWEGCDYQYATGVTPDGRRAHLLTHTRLACQWPDCGHIAAQDSTPDERRAHLLYHVRLICPWPHCNHKYPENSTEHDREQHVIHEHMPWCQWEGCNHRHGEEDDNSDVKEHYRAHVGAEAGPTGLQPVISPLCVWPGCNHKFADNVTLDDKRAHFRTHMSLRCPIPSCNYTFAPAATGDEKRAHMRSHCSRECIWPGCEFIFVQEPTTEEIASHMLSHAPTQGVPARPQGPEPPENDAAATDIEDNNIPQHLKDAHPGMNFYCPVCFRLVSGKNVSACKRHREGNCNVKGHNDWLILTAGQLKGRKDAAAKTKKGRKAAPRRGDDTYKPVGGENGDDGDDGTQGSDTPVPAGPRRSGRKRRPRNEPEDEAGDEAGSSKKKQKK